MESRAYGSTPKPTSLYAMRLRWYDVAVVVGSLLLFSAATLYIYHFVSFRV
jgi:energy-coupling factor transporter transmembrane protein EcfT